MNEPTGDCSSPAHVSADVDFLDHLVQDHYGLGLKLEYCLTLINDSPSQAEAGIDAAIHHVSDLIEPIRNQIMRLNAKGPR